MKESKVLKKRLLFLVNVDWAFLSHRLPIAIEALNQGYEVHVATVVTDKLATLHSYGLIVHPLAIRRGKVGFISEVRAVWDIFKLFIKLRPHIVHLVTLKPVLFGGIVARLTGVSSVVVAIPGLGFVFMARGLKASIIRFFVGKLYRFVLGKKNLKAIFQNSSDRKIITQATGLAFSKAVMIPGSGVNLSTYAVKKLPEDIPVVAMASRLVCDKGVHEFISSARLLRQRGYSVKFVLIGEPDIESPTSVTEANMDQWRDEGVVHVLGYQKDISNLFSQTNIVVLPSYREGLPKVLVEAAACGRAVVTTDVPGCRDAIEPGKSGLLVPVKDSMALADAIQHLIDNPELCKSMGQAGRALAERKFSIETVVEAHMEIYKALGTNV